MRPARVPRSAIVLKASRVPSGEVLGRKVEHRCNAFLNQRIEQDHRGVKQRYYPMLGLVLSTRRSAFVEPSRRCGSTFAPGAKESNSCHSHAIDDSLSGEYTPSSRCSALPNQSTGRDQLPENGGFCEIVIEIHPIIKCSR